MKRRRRWERDASGQTRRPSGGSAANRRAPGKVASGSEANNDWTLPWSDLMLTMFILFLTLYAMQLERARPKEAFESARLRPGVRHAVSAPPEPSRPDGGDPVSGNVETERPRWNAVEARVTRQEDLAGTALEEQSAYRLVLTGDVLFENGSAELKPAAFGVLEQAADWIGPTPHKIAVAGHTDALPVTSGSFASNWELSAARAAGVARFLIEELRMPASRVFVTGHADNEPLDTNRTPAGRRRNRRVEIVVTRELPTHRRESRGAP